MRSIDLITANENKAVGIRQLLLARGSLVMDLLGCCWGGDYDKSRTMMGASRLCEGAVTRGWLGKLAWMRDVYECAKHGKEMTDSRLEKILD